MMGHLYVQGYARKKELVIGKTLLEHLRDLGVDINASCGGLGECKQCLVQVNKTNLLSPLTDTEREFIRQPEYRLSCQARVLGDDEDLFVIVPERSFTILPTGKRKDIELDPYVTRLPSQGNTVYWRNKEIGIYEGALLGLALDIGTTTLSMYCTDLETGKDVIVVSRENPQMKYGNDVISRITYARDHGQEPLEKEIRKAVNGMIQQPYTPYMKTGVHKRAQEIGLIINPKAVVYGMPLISGFVGADCIGVVLATNLHRESGLNIAIDIGTNTEIVIGNKERMIATSCASGPAFEGVGIKWGVAGVGGAIKNVSIDEDLEVHYETIGDLPPIGICGSGLIDVLANMLDRDIIDWRGRFTEERSSFVIVDRDNPITISEEDIDKLKLAKAAISLGVKTLVKLFNSTLEGVDTIYLAGGFGNFISVENSKKIGLLPDIELSKIERVGNAALEGAREALLSKSRRREVYQIEEKTEHKSLESIPDFSYEYMKELSFEKYMIS